MLALKAIKSDKIWGYELWIASTHPNGKQDAFEKFCGGSYPLLVKVIQANDKLSVQIHPDDATARLYEGENACGKTECWYVLDAEKDARLVCGLNGIYTASELRKAIKANSIQDCLNYVSVKKGDFVYIPSGTVHAIGGGLRLLEVQQSCDITYRFYDWGRVEAFLHSPVSFPAHILPLSRFLWKANTKVLLMRPRLQGAWKILPFFL